MSSSKHLVYTCFDHVPSPKGAAVHIQEVARALGQQYGALDLVTPNVELSEPRREPSRWPGVDHCELPGWGKDPVQRCLTFRRELSRYFASRTLPCDVVHFRSAFEGYPLALYKPQVARSLLFEVNALPSIELRYHHPRVAEDAELLRKIRAQEQLCLHQADAILTPSAVTRAFLQTRGVAPDKVHVIENGVHLELFPDGDAGPPQRGPGDPLRVLYAGTFAPWQGVSVALEAVARYAQHSAVRLTLVGPTRGHQAKLLSEACEKLGILGHVRRVPALTQPEVAALHREHDVIVAPLLANDRNLRQGCCPLKVLEAMASGVPLLASDLQVVRDLARHGEHAWLVPPGSAEALEAGLVRLASDWELCERLSRAARQRIEQRFTWQHSSQRLLSLYAYLLGEEGVSAGLLGSGQAIEQPA